MVAVELALPDVFVTLTKTSGSANSREQLPHQIIFT
jgi:hypothetical protein